MTDIDFTPFLVSLKLSIATTVILLGICLPLASLFAFRRFYGKPFIETLVSLPLVIPPTVLGFYLLTLLSPYNAFGRLLGYFSIKPLFSFSGLLFASCIYSLPFMFQPLKDSLVKFDKQLILASYACGKSRKQTFFHIVLPNISPHVFTAAITTFAHTMGGFGVFLMVGGSIPGVTKVASIAIYENVMELDFKSANVYSLILLLLSLVILFTVKVIDARMDRKNDQH
jgi:molybdate transport system permease protein